MSSVMSAGNNGGGCNGGCSEGGKQKKTAHASPRKGCMKGKGGPLNASCTFKGVRQRTWGRWVAEIRDSDRRKRIWLGTFNNAREAALAYDEAAKKLFGANAHLNLPDEVEVAAKPTRSSASQRAMEMAMAQAEARHRKQLLLDMQIKKEIEMHKEMEFQKYMDMLHYNIINNVVETPVETLTENHLPEKRFSFESIFNNLNGNWPEFNDNEMWEEAASTMDYQTEAMCDPGISAHTFGDAIGIELKHPFMG